MSLSSTFRSLVSGQQAGPLATLCRCLLRIAEVPYSAVVRLRNKRFDRQAANAFRAEVPVISIGNLTLGGTGKTPLVAWIANYLRQQDLRLALVSRGYGASRGKPNDEARLLQEQLPDVPHVQNANRAAAIGEAIEKYHAEVILLDDGFQHRAVARDLDIVLLDATEPFGFDHVFPRGTLREPPAGLARCQVVVLSRCNMIGEREQAQIRERVKKLSPDALWCRMASSPTSLLSLSRESAECSELLNVPLVAFCGIGNPAGFSHTLAECGYDIRGFNEYADHYSYKASDLEEIESWAASLQAEAIVCTHKDLVKIPRDYRFRLPIWSVQIGCTIREGENTLIEALDNVLRKSNAC